MKTYQYSILRYRRSKSAGELVNIGLVMAVPDDGAVFHYVTPRYSRLSDFFGGFDSEGYQRLLAELRRHFDDVLQSAAGEPRQLDLSEYIATRDLEQPSLDELRTELIPEAESCFVWSDFMSGIHPRPETRFRQLRYEFIGRHEEARKSRERRNENKIQSTVVQYLRHSRFARHLVFDKRLRGKLDVEHTFPVAWQNGTTQVIDAISFDYKNKESIKKKADQWCGTLFNLADNGEDFRFTGVVAPPPERDLFDVFDQACRLIGDMEQTRDLIEEEHIERLDAELAADLS